MKVNFKESWNHLMELSIAHKPEVLTGVGVTLMIVAVPLAVVGTIQATKKIDEKKKEAAEELRENSENPDILIDPETVELAPVEVAKVIWPYCVGPAVAVVAGAFCSIAAQKESLRRTAEALGMYQLSQAAFDKYKEKTKEVVGDKKEEEIHNRVIKDRMELMTDNDGHVVNIYDTRDGSTLCFDYECGRYFYSDIDYMKSQLNMLNAEALKDVQANPGAFLTLNDVYRVIGLPETGIGERLVWRIMKEGLPTIKPTSMLIDDKPCFVLNFEQPPVYASSWQLDRM